MGRVYHSGEMALQVKTMNQMFELRIQEAEQVNQAIEAFVQNQELQGEAYLNYKNHFHNTHGNVFKAMKYGCQAMIDANNELLRRYQALVGGGTINTFILLDGIESLHYKLQMLQNIPDPTAVTSGLMMHYVSMIKGFQKKVDDLELFNNQTGSIYDDAESYFRSAEEGLALLEEPAWNDATGRFRAIDTSWADNVKQKYIDDMKQKFSVDGKITEAGYQYLENMVQKELSYLSDEEVILATFILCQNDSEKEMRRILSIGYCVEGSMVVNGVTLTSYSPSPTFQFLVLGSSFELQNSLDELDYNNPEAFDNFERSYQDKMAYNNMLMNILHKAPAMSEAAKITIAETNKDSYSYVSLFHESNENGQMTLHYTDILLGTDIDMLSFSDALPGAQEHAENMYVKSYRDELIRDLLQNASLAALSFGISAQIGAESADALKQAEKIKGRFDYLQTGSDTYNQLMSIYSATTKKGKLIQSMLDTQAGGAFIGELPEDELNRTKKLVSQLNLLELAKNYKSQVTMTDEYFYLNRGVHTQSAIDEKNSQIQNLNSHIDGNNYDRLNANVDNQDLNRGTVRDFYEKIQMYPKYEKMFFPNGEKGGLVIPELQGKDFNQDIQKTQLVDEISSSLKDNFK